MPRLRRVRPGDSSRIGRIARRIARWVDPLAGTDTVQFKDSKEIALDNAEHALGAAQEVDSIDKMETRRRQAWRKRVVVSTLVVVSVLAAACIAWVETAGEVIVQTRLGTPESPVVLPGPDPIAGTLSLEMPGDGATIINSVYMDEHNAVCSSMFESTGGIAQFRAAGGCLKLTWLRERLGSECAIWSGGGGLAGHIVLRGFAHADVVGIEGRVPPVRGPNRIVGPMRVLFTKLWVPDAAGDDSDFEPFRAFMVVARYVRRKVSAPEFDTAQYADPYTYKLTARLENGQAAVLKGFGPIGEPAYGASCG